MNGSTSFPDGDLIFVADAHLRPGHAEVGRFVSFLADIRAPVSVLFILGDLFDTWFGHPELQREHHREIVAALREVACAGVRIHFVEGNREFRIERGFLGDPFDRVAADDLVADCNGRLFYLTHGDLINRKDWQYRTWRAFSKSRLTQGAFGLLPVGTRHRAIAALERSLKGTNHRHRKQFPIEPCRDFARRVFTQGVNTIILGHFHEERVIRFVQNGTAKDLYVLPAWCDGGGYLRFSGPGPGEFIWEDGRRQPAGDIAVAADEYEARAARSRSEPRHTPQPASPP